MGNWILRLIGTKKLMPLVLLVALALIFVSSAHAVTVTDTTPTSAASTNSNWTNPNNALTQNGNTADWKNTDQSYLVLTGFNFSTIPAGAQIDGITVTVRGEHSSGSATYRQYQVGLTKNGSAVAGNLDTTGEFGNAGLQDFTHGSNTDLWGTTWTDADLKSANFGVMLTDNDTTQTGTSPGYSIDVMYVTVDYTVTCSPVPAPTIGGSVNGDPINLCSVVTEGTNTGTNYKVTEGASADDNFNDNSLDAKWTKTDIGPDTGSVSESGGQLSLDGGGADIWNNADEFTYLSQSGISGDFSIQVRVLSQQNTNGWAKAGLMVRETLAAGSKDAYMVTTPANGARWQFRDVTDAAAQNPSTDQGGSSTAPVWLRITRTGDSFTGEFSTNGTNWTTSGTDTVVMADPVYIGLANTSHSAGVLSTAVFEDFVTTGIGSTLYDGATCNSVSTSGWSNGTKDLEVTYTDNCGSTGQLVNGTFSFTSCTDTDLATLTTTDPGTAAGVVTIQTSVGVEAAPATMSSMTIDIAGAGACNVSGGSMSWNGGSSRWEYSWDTSACGTGAPVSGITIDVSGNEPDCSNPLISAPQITGVTIDNTCTPSGTIIWNGTTTAAGDFSGASLVGSTSNVGTVEYQIVSTGGAGVVSQITPWAGAYNGTAASPATIASAFNVAAGPAEQMLFVFVAPEGGTQTDVDVTYGGVAMDKAGMELGSNNDSFVLYMNAAKLASRSGNDLVVTAVGSTWTQLKVDYTVLDGVDQSTAQTNFASYGVNSSTTGPFTMTPALNVAAGDLVIAGINDQRPQTDINYSLSPAEFTENHEDNVGNNSIVTYTRNNTNANAALSVSATKSVTAGGNKSGWALAVKAAAAGGGTVIPWSTDPLSPAPSGVMSNGGYEIYARALDATCTSDYIYGDPSATNTTADGTPKAFTYNTIPVDSMTVGVATAPQASPTSILATMPYTDDDNDNGTFTVRYKLQAAGSYTDHIVGATDPGASPYITTIPGLTTGETYDVQMTYADADGLSGTAVQVVQLTLVAWTDSALLHNSNRFPGTTKHSGDWGTPTGQYGGFTCGTCHEKNPANGNIKRVRSTITAPSSPGLDFPGGAASPVTFLSAEDGTSDMGDDSAAPRANSTRVCEVCHTYDVGQTAGVQQHSYDQVVAANHFDGSDCIKCHLHKQGFKAACDTCHGNPPINNTAGGPDGLDNTANGGSGTGSTTAGKHDLHANTLGYGCNTCHTGWENAGEMPKNGDLNLGFDAFGDTTGNYNGRSAGSYTRVAGTGGTDNDALTCSAIYCHGSASPAWTNAATAPCGSCHGDATGAPLEVGGDGDLAGSTTGTKVGKHSQHLAESTARTGDACSLCHPNGNAHVGGAINGSNDIVLHSSAGGGASFTPGTSTCASLACHQDAVWDTASTGGCNFCHGYPPELSGSNNLHVGTPVDHSAAAITGSHGECNTCHGYSQANGATDNTGAGGDAYQLSYHRDGNIEMNGISAPDDGQSTDYQTGTFGCAAACHPDDASHRLSDSGLTVQLHEYGGGDCTGCHVGSGGGALNVSSASPHSENATGYTCVDCHGGHGAGDVEVPNNTSVGINYTGNGEGGISLSDPVGTATTEAEICWNCHNQGGVNADWRTGGDYNGFSISARNWTTATFNAPGSAIPNRLVVSIHSANSVDVESPAPATPGIGANATVRSSSVGNNVDTSGRTSNHGSFSGTKRLEAVSSIRCSYCHDVHDLNLASGDSNSGVPYLRGSWLSNPYPLERPPESGDTYANNDWGQRVTPPRLYADSAASAETGGFFIDQNSSWPTRSGSSYMTVSATAGICVLCHGSTTDSMDYYAGDSLWNGNNNGHRNSTLGGSGGTTGVNNLFNARRTSQGGAYMHAQGASTASNSQWGNSSSRKSQMPDSQTFRGSKPAKEGGGTVPVRNTGWYNEGASGTNTRGGQYTQWYGTGIGNDGDGNNPARAHNFSCSKCHTPHASGLPALLITNCLDYQISTWSGNMSPKTVGPAGDTGDNWVMDIMGNCHRKENASSGWNSLLDQQ